jgi:hypothetical protein
MDFHMTPIRERGADNEGPSTKAYAPKKITSAANVIPG